MKRRKIITTRFIISVFISIILGYVAVIAAAATVYCGVASGYAIAALVGFGTSSLVSVIFYAKGATKRDLRHRRSKIQHTKRCC